MNSGLELTRVLWLASSLELESEWTYWWLCPLSDRERN